MRRDGAMRGLIDAVSRAFAAVSAGSCHHPPRVAVPSERGTTLLMGAAIEGLGRTAKVVSVFPGNLERGEASTQGLLLSLCPESGRVLALMDAARLTAWRTGAGSGLATDLLASSDASRLGLIGAGAQALTQAHAVCAVRPIEELLVYSRNAARLKVFCEQAEAALQRPVRPATSADAVVEFAQVLCLATTSREPVIDGRGLTPGTHVNGVGSFRLDMREADRHTISRAHIIVDEVAAALAEAGELVDARDAGLTRSDDWIEIGELVSGKRSLSQSDDTRDITFFKSVGHPAQDIAAAAFFSDSKLLPP
jgi:ornithine cyclodeaminase